MSSWKIGYKFVKHLINARHTGGFGIHSPFIFQFVTNVLSDRYSFYSFNDIEKLRIELKSDMRKLYITDFGSKQDREVKVSEIARKSLKSKKYGQLLFRIIRYFNAKNVLELGTSLGITTAYLASVSTNIQCLTLEGCPQTANLALQNFKKLGLSNIELKLGDINKTLPELIAVSKDLDFVFIDANHRSLAVLAYFELILTKIHQYSVLVVDDIYWSEDMEMAWKEIKNHPNVYGTIDLFEIGIVFFNTDLNKKHYQIRF